MEAEKGFVFNVQRFCVNDGPGIRTTVFMKGCMLNCLWCHNPESKYPKPQLLLHEKKCLQCRECAEVCPHGYHEFDQGRHIILRSHCTGCGACVDACFGALELCGKEMTVEEIMTEVLKDQSFYRNSGGGVTLSGGDPLFRPDFTLSLLKKSKEYGLHTCIETCGHAAFEDVEALLPYTDLFLWDVKETDPALHKRYTGVSNERILENLCKINDLGAKIVLRCPIIPSYNDRDEHLKAIGRLAEELDGVSKIDVEPYHPLGTSKNKAFGKSDPLKGVLSPSDETVRQWIDVISAETTKPVTRA